MSFVETIVQSVRGQLESLNQNLMEQGVDVDGVLSKSSQNQRPKCEKVYIPKKSLQDEMVYIVKNYGRSYALFGPFNQRPLKEFKEQYLDGQKGITYKKNLAYGPGWLIFSSTKIEDLQKKFKDEGIQFKEMEKTEFDEKWRNYRKDSDDDEGSSQSDKYDLNEWGNIYETTTGIVFVEIFKEKVAVGKQDKESKEKGLDSIFKLTSEDEKICKEHKWFYINYETFDNLSKIIECLKRIFIPEVINCMLEVPIIDKIDNGTGEIKIQVQFPSKSSFERHKEEAFEGIIDQLEQFIAQGWEGDNKIKGVIKVLRKLEKLEDDYLVIEN